MFLRELTNKGFEVVESEIGACLINFLSSIIYLCIVCLSILSLRFDLFTIQIQIFSLGEAKMDI